MGEAGKKKGGLVFWLALAALVATLPLAWWLFLSGGPPPRPVPPRVEARDAGVEGPVRITLSEVQGQVELRASGADGGWRPAKQGDVLEAAAGVRTGDGAVAVMVGGEKWEVRMEPGTEVEVGELSSQISRLMLANGMAHATVKGEGRHTFEVKASVGDAVARTDAGVFTISHNGAGTVAVGAQEGEVEFSGRGKVVIVRAGQGALVRPGQAPSDPAPLPASLLLKVALPAASVTNKPRVVVTGEVFPGSHVTLGGRAVPTDAEGRFSAPLVLKDGKHTLAVRAVGVGNQDAASTHQLDVKTQVKKVTIENPWKKK